MSTLNKLKPQENLADNRIAVYIAGDSKVYFPAVVAIESIQRMNPHLPLDFYISFDEEDLTAEHVEMFSRYRIDFVPTRKLNAFGSVDELPMMKEEQWPQHVFYNWLMPDFLYNIGYRYALKADYDLLCMSPYKLFDIQGHKSLFQASLFTVNLEEQGVPQTVAVNLGLPESVLLRTEYFNAGFASINLTRYSQLKVFNHFSMVYGLLMKECPDVPNAEQAAWALTCARVQEGLTTIDRSYNHRATTLPQLDHEGRAIIKNLHFVTHNKPWRAPNYKYLRGYVGIGRTCLYIYREAWLKAASRIPGFNRHVDVPVPDDLESIGVLATVLGEHYRQKR